MSTESMKLQEIMSQAQVFASAWSLVGGRFDGGNAMDEAEVAKNELYQMVAEALAAQPQQKPVAWMHEWEDGEKIPMLKGRDDRNQDKPKTVRPLVYGDTSPQPAQPQQEPVAWMNAKRDMTYLYGPYNADDIPLYTSLPAQRKPLTDEEIETVWRSVQANDFHDCVKPFARAIEAAHGIKGDA